MAVCGVWYAAGKHGKYSSGGAGSLMPRPVLTFCWTCGEKLIVIRRRDHFDIETGAEIVVAAYRCPNSRWWKLGHWIEPEVIVFD